MTEQEKDDMINMVFPVGEDRWIKLKYLDRDKCLKAFRIQMRQHEPTLEEIEAGYQVMSIGLRDEYAPQVSALLDLKADIIGYLYGHVKDYQIEAINRLFKEKIEEVNRHTIKAKEVQ